MIIDEFGNKFDVTSKEYLANLAANRAAQERADKWYGKGWYCICTTYEGATFMDFMAGKPWLKEEYVWCDDMTAFIDKYGDEESVQYMGFGDEPDRGIGITISGMINEDRREHQRTWTRVEV